ncbi:uncharacterized protein [Ciconia boyciana]|uniref:uncharacterized protein n=1 Tax=Ciconia boyciana TaxID=52775 RepID=UPI003B9E8E23
MMVTWAPPAASPETAFPPRSPRRCRRCPPAPPGHAAPRPARTTFPAFPYPCRPSRRCPQPPSGGGGGGAVRAAGAPCILRRRRRRRRVSRSATGHGRSPPPRLVAVLSPPCQRYPGAVLPSRVLLPPLPRRRLTRRQQISSGSSRCSGAASPRSSSAPVTPLPAPCPGSPQGLCNLPRWQPAGSAAGRPPARPAGAAGRRRAAGRGQGRPAGQRRGAASAPQAIRRACPSPFPPWEAGNLARERHRAEGARPGELPPSALGTAGPTAAAAAAAPPRGHRAPPRPQGDPSGAGGGAGLSAAASVSPRPREAVREGGGRCPCSPTRRRGLPGAGGGAARGRRAGPATPGSQRPLRAAAERNAPPGTARPRHGPTRRPTRPGGRQGRGGRGSPLPLPPPRGVRRGPRRHFNLKQAT